MSESQPPPKSLSQSNKGERPRSGYVRSLVTHIGTEWSFEVLSDDNKVGLVTIQTGDGPVYIGVNRTEATNLVQKLQLFLQDWPKDQLKS